MVNPWFESIAEAQRRARKRLPKSVYDALLAGSEKADAAWRAFVDQPSEHTPASLVRAQSGRTTAILDRAAAAKLEG